MNEVWRARSGIVARGCARGRVRSRQRGSGRRCGGEPSASVRGYRARRADGTRVHLLGTAGHGGHPLDHLEVGAGHNETSHFTELLEPVDLAGAVVTFDASIPCGRTWTGWQGRRKPATSPS
jgi:hypothetical protein